MKMTDIPALPKLKKPLNRRVYDLAWFPFAALAELLVAVTSQYKAGFVVAGLLAAIGTLVSAVAGDLTTTRITFFLVAFGVMGLVFTVGLSAIALLTRR